MTRNRFGLIFAIVLFTSIIPGQRAAAAYTNLQLAESAALSSVLCEDMTTGTSQRVWATMLECRFPTQAKPAGCRAATVTGHTVSLTLTGCKSPALFSPTTGLKTPGESVTGSVDAVFKKDAKGLHVHTTGTGLKIGSATLAVDDTTTFRSAAGVETVSVSHSSSGVDALGHAVSNTGSLTSTDSASSGCLTLNGSWKVESNGVTAVNLKYCHKSDGTWGCPSGTITFTSDDRTTTATYNGSNILSLRLPNGTSESVPLTCVP